jgi:RNA polymerase sigma-70 factor (ECF subfamily)
MHHASRPSTTARVDRLLERLIAGDAQAKAAVIERSQRRLTELARRQMHGFPAVARWEQTDDVVQGASVRLHRALEHARPPNAREFFYLAAAVIRRELIDLKRRLFGPGGVAAHHASPRPELPSGSGPDVADAAGGTFDPAKLARWTELHEHVERLPEELREVFDLLWYDQLTHDEAAQALGVSTKTVQRRWREARLALHHLVEDGEL